MSNASTHGDAKAMDIPIPDSGIPPVPASGGGIRPPQAPELVCAQAAAAALRAALACRRAVRLRRQAAGEPRVNVLELNLAVEKAFPKK